MTEEDDAVEERQKQLWDRITPGVEKRLYVAAMQDLLIQSPALLEVVAERKRQFDKNYTIEFDRQEHKKGGLLMAARGYLWAGIHLADRIAHGNPGRRFMKFPPFQWPWMDGDWNPDLDSPNNNLVRAATLIIAEIDRRMAEGLM